MQEPEVNKSSEDITSIIFSQDVLNPGEMFGQYKIDCFLARGGMANVYKTIHNSGEISALKILISSNKSELSFKRFMNEAEVAKHLGKHPNIVTIFETGTIDNLNFIAMDYVSGGKTLLETIKKRPMDFQQVLKIGKLLASALFHSHEHGVIHRDLKPSNILISEAGVPLLTDFGLATYDGDFDIVVEGTTVGTPIYMSPEQADGNITEKSIDIYSFGVLLYEMFTGHIPYDIKDDTALLDVLDKVRFSPTIPPNHFNSNLSKETCLFLAHLLEKNPNDRYANMQEILNDLEALQANEPLSIKAPRLSEKFEKKIRRSPMMAFGIGIAIMLGISCIYFLFSLLNRQNYDDLIENLHSEESFEKVEDKGFEIFGKARVTLAKGEVVNAREILKKLSRSNILKDNKFSKEKINQAIARTFLAEKKYIVAIAKCLRNYDKGDKTSIYAQLSAYEAGVGFWLNSEYDQAQKQWKTLLFQKKLHHQVYVLCKTATSEEAPEVVGLSKIAKLYLKWYIVEKTGNLNLIQEENLEEAKNLLPWLYLYWKEKLKEK